MYFEYILYLNFSLSCPLNPSISVHTALRLHVFHSYFLIYSNLCCLVVLGLESIFQESYH